MPVYLPGLTFGGLGYGGSSYGYSPYGSGVFPRLPVPVDGGYGGQQYGINSYGSIDIIPPKVTGANSLDGFRVEVLFSEEMKPNAALTDPSNYTFTDLFGVPLVSESVAPGTPGILGGYTSVIVTHSGSTLGGQYQVVVTTVEDMAGNEIDNSPATFSAFGDITSVEISFLSPDDGRTVRLDFKDSRGFPQDLLTEAEFTPGVESTDSYDISTTYPIAPTLSNPTQNPALLSQVDLDIHPMTSALYDLIVGPSLAYDYTGTVLPDDDPSFTGVEVGTGSSTPTAVNGLLISKAIPDVYGWRFEDTTGRVLLGTSYRADFQFNASAATILPPVASSSLLTFAVSDGSVQVNLTLADIAGIKIIQVDSGTLSTSVAADWSSAEATVSLLRNQQAGFYTILLDGVPLLTVPIASANGAPTIPAGTSVVFGPLHNVGLFRLLNVNFTASATIFTSAWNFIHGLASTFTGSAVLTRDRIFTKRGPLVRGWGDNTPAVKEDVEVRLNGGVVDLAGVNPYVGEIYPVIPIPRAAPGVVNVEIDYIWFSNPAFELAGLNTRGLGLNIWDRAVGHTPGAVSPTPPSSTGALKGNRFPMGIVLAPYTRPSPKAIGHRYIGFQKEYSALLNEPTTLLLNQDPHAIAIGNLTADALTESGSFDGLTTPQDATTNWALDGVDDGGVVGDGTYRVIDQSSGSFGVGTAAVYNRQLDLSLDTMVSESARFFLESYVVDGVFTGVGVGVHDGHHLMLVGALIVDGVQHVGILLDGENPHLEESWQIGPSAEVTATSQTMILMDLTDLPPGVEAGSRFRVAEGTQSGVYEISECGITTTEDGSQVEITITGEFPADVTLFGNDTFIILFETPWEQNLLSIRIEAQFPEGYAQATLGGVVSGLIAEIDDLPAFPAQTALLLPAYARGVVFWGSISRRAENSSIWDFVQYQSNPERLTQTARGLTAQTEMNVLPEDDPNDPWYIVGKFGNSFVDASGDYTVIKATSASDDLPFEFSYQRVEPFLSTKVTTDTEAKFRVESGRLGAGDVLVSVRDGTRGVTFTNLLYVEGTYIDPETGLTNVGRTLVTDLPRASLSGLIDPVGEGWAKIGSMPDPFVRGQTLQVTKTVSETATWYKNLDDPVDVDYEGIISEARFSVEQYAVGSVGIGAAFGAAARQSSTQTRAVIMGLGVGTIQLFDSSLTSVTSFPYAWDDGEPHTYRLLIDPSANNVVLLVDDVVIGSEAFSSFLASPDPVRAYFGTVGDGACRFTLHSTSAIALRPAAKAGQTINRTFGILLRDKNPDRIDSYQIPRTDGTAAPNSSLTAIPVPMDWRSFAHVRLLLDPTWGVSFYRPDLPLPPWATGDYITETTDPTAAWMYVEYADLPLSPTIRGSVAFGSVDSRAITQSRWDFMRYRIRGEPDGFGIAPQNMVLNRAFTFTSGEWNIDVTPEVRTVTSRTSTFVKVSDSAIYADRVFVVQVDDTVLSSSDWGFDKDSQSLILVNPLPSAQYPVTITFAAGQPITKEYLCSQPFEGSVTVLNEGTPPVPASRDEAATLEEILGSKINDPDDVLDDAESMILNDPYRFVQFQDTENSLYASTEFCDVEDGESVHLSSLCDGPGPGEGLAELGLEGQFTTDHWPGIEEGPAGPWGGQSPVIKGSATHFNPGSVLFVSGGSYVDGVLGPGTAILYPNAAGENGETPAGRFGMNQDYLMVLTDATPREELFDLGTLMGDNVPPTSADPETNPNPDGVPGTFLNGKVAYEMVDYGTTSHSKLGPWGGLAVLSTNSLLGGGAQLTGVEFILNGGAELDDPTVTTGFIEAAN